MRHAGGVRTRRKEKLGSYVLAKNPAISATITAASENKFK
jgi:hypothetical protein